jgi:hypothetical protein
MGWESAVGTVIAFTPAADQPMLSAHDLIAIALRQNAALASHIVALTTHMIAQDRRIAELEARSPQPRFEPRAGRLTAKQAAFASGYALSTIHRWFRSGAIGGEREGVRILIDPDMLPMRK